MPKSLRVALLLLILTAAVLFTFAPTLKNDFVNFDDQNEITENPDLNPVTLHKLTWNWTHTRLSLYMPITYMTWGAIASIAPRNQAGTLQAEIFHSFSIFLHLCCCLLLFTLILQLFHHPVAAFTGALLFALHPLQAEPVAWASGMYTLLSTALCLAALIAYIANATNTLKMSPENSSVRCWTLDVGSWTFAFLSKPLVLYIFATTVYILALLTKPASVSLPLIAAAIDLFLLRRPLLQVVKSVYLWFLLAIPIVLLAKHFQDVSMLATPPIWARPLIALDALGFYLKKILLPINLTPDYGRNPSWILQHPATVALSIAIVTIAILIAIATRRRTPSFFAALAVLIAGTAPYLGLTTFDFQYVSTVADRYAYFGLIGIAIFAAALACRSRLASVALIIIAVACAIQTHNQVKHWQNTDTLFNYTQSINPNSLISHNIFGFTAARQHHFKEAESHYLAALQIWPQDATIQFNLGNLYLPNRPDLAIEHYQLAVKYQPKMSLYHNNLAIAFLRIHDPAQAFTELNLAIDKDPTYIDAHNNLADLFANASLIEKAREQYQTVLQIDPTNRHATTALANLTKK